MEQSGIEHEGLSAQEIMFLCCGCMAARTHARTHKHHHATLLPAPLLNPPRIAGHEPRARRRHSPHPRPGGGGGSAVRRPKGGTLPLISPAVIGTRPAVAPRSRGAHPGARESLCGSLLSQPQPAPVAMCARTELDYELAVQYSRSNAASDSFQLMANVCALCRVWCHAREVRAVLSFCLALHTPCPPVLTSTRRPAFLFRVLSSPRMPSSVHGVHDA